MPLVAVITGSARGIGRGCARALAGLGADIVLNDRPGNPDLAAAAAELRALGRRVVALEEDVVERAGCQRLIDHALAELGRIDILVSNVAISHRQPLLEYDPDEFERVLRGSLTAGFHIGQLAARHMVARGGGGRMVFISSVHAALPVPRCAAYNAAKAGLNHLAATMAVELAPQRINVNVIEPGAIDTPGERIKFGQEFLDRFGATLPAGRMGREDDIGAAAAFLCSPAADYITGTVLRVDGGFMFKDLR